MFRIIIKILKVQLKIETYQCFKILSNKRNKKPTLFYFFVFCDYNKASFFEI